MRFRVVGAPAPQGSHRAFVRGGRAIVTDDSASTRPWRSDVRAAALEAMGDAPPPDGPVSVDVTFLFARPRAHLRADGTVRPSAPAAKVTRPDLDKLLRSTMDALTGIAWRDDAQVVSIAAAKAFVNRPDRERPGAIVAVDPLPARPVTGVSTRYLDGLTDEEWAAFEEAIG